MRRRDFVLGLTGTVVASEAEARLLLGGSGGQAPSSSVNDFVVSLSSSGTVFNGSTSLAFHGDGSNGTTVVNMGDYVGEFYRCKCYLLTNAAAPDWRCWIRPAADSNGNRIIQPASGWRDEVIIEQGRTYVGTPTNVETSYTATITKSGTGVTGSPFTVPQHFCRSRWRYKSSDLPVVRTPATLISRNWIPKFGSTGLFGNTGNATSITWPGPMGHPSGTINTESAFDVNMGDTGDNPQIGHLTEGAADYAIFGSAASLTWCRVEGEWCSVWPIHIRDDTSNAPVNVQTASFSATGEVGNGGTILNTPSSADSNYVNVEGAHYYPCATLPFMLFDDPFFLEAMQFGATWLIIDAFFHRSQQNIRGMINPNQPRAFAWGLREIISCLMASPVSPPSWLMPQNYWQSCFNDCMTFLNRYVNGTTNLSTLFHAWTLSDAQDSWMVSWLNFQLGRATQASISGASGPFAWGIQQHTQMCSGSSGWKREVPYGFTWFPIRNWGNNYQNNGFNFFYVNQVPWVSGATHQPYDQVTSNGNRYATTAGGTSGSTAPSGTGSGISDGGVTWECPPPSDSNSASADFSANICTSWADAWSYFKSGSPDATDGNALFTNGNGAGCPFSDSSFDGTTIENVPGGIAPANTSSVYFQHLRCALAIAQTLAVSGASAIYTWYQNQMTTRVMPAFGNPPGECRFSIDP